MLKGHLDPFGILKPQMRYVEGEGEGGGEPPAPPAPPADWRSELPPEVTEADQ